MATLRFQEELILEMSRMSVVGLRSPGMSRMMPPQIGTDGMTRQPGMQAGMMPERQMGVNDLQDPAAQPAQRPENMSPVTDGTDVAQNGEPDSQDPSAPDNPANQVTLSGGGHGSGCGHCNMMVSGKMDKSKLEALKATQYAQIMAHEMAHAAAAGSLGGPIQINYDANGIAVSGSVPVKMPSLNESDPQETVQQAQQVYRAALAPTDPSGPDRAIAARAASMLSRAQAKVSQREAAIRQGNPSGGQNPFGGPNPNPMLAMNPMLNGNQQPV